MTVAQHGAIVIGAGVAGLSTALYLQRAGVAVAVIDPLGPAGGASFGNAGMLSPDTAVPIALPGMLRKVPGWLTDPLGPLSVRPSYFPRALPWLLRWIESGRLQRVLAISDAMRALHREYVGLLAGASGARAVSRSDPSGRPGAGMGRGGRYCQRRGGAPGARTPRHPCRGTQQPTTSARCSPASRAR